MSDRQLYQAFAYNKQAKMFDHFTFFFLNVIRHLISFDMCDPQNAKQKFFVFQMLQNTE